MENFKETICSCALNRIFGFAPKTGLALITHMGSAAEVFRLTAKDLDNLLGPYSRYRSQISQKAADEAEKELAELEKLDIRFTGWSTPHYPELLRECPDAPIGLYVRSTTPPEELWAPRRRIAVVGTRDISPYGREWCIRTVTEMAASQEKPTIVSGLALGTDFYAHRTAMECGLPTIAVMATGPESVYPQRHREFAERLYHTKGCALISDYPPGTAPLSVHFLRRNRIIAGLSEATILIESKLKGGGMMTSNLAFSYSRDVHALPGRLDDIRSQGCNHLIKSKVAEAIFSTEELISNLGLSSLPKHKEKPIAELVSESYEGRIPGEQLSAMKEILNLIRRNRGMSLDEIAAVSGAPYHKILNICNMLETDGFICIDLLQRCSLTLRH